VWVSLKNTRLCCEDPTETEDVFEVKKFLKTGKVFIPNDANHALYQKHFEQYKNLYPAFKNIKQ
jgi:sugar (pentulose or hexulose) kinase